MNLKPCEFRAQETSNDGNLGPGNTGHCEHRTLGTSDSGNIGDWEYMLLGRLLPNYQQHRVIISTFSPQVSSFKAVSCTGWTRGVLVTVALVAAVTIFGALWVEGRA